jgi:hypothetical protein
MKNKFQAQHKKYERKRTLIIKNGCGGKKGTKCGVEVYIMPYMEKV